MMYQSDDFNSSQAVIAGVPNPVNGMQNYTNLNLTF